MGSVLCSAIQHTTASHPTRRQLRCARAHTCFKKFIPAIRGLDPRLSAMALAHSRHLAWKRALEGTSRLCST